MKSTPSLFNAVMEGSNSRLPLTALLSRSMSESLFGNTNLEKKGDYDNDALSNLETFVFENDAIGEDQDDYNIEASDKFEMKVVFIPLVSH
jgi:hypothetical protein